MSLPDNHAFAVLRGLLREVPAQLAAINSDKVAQPSAPGKWSPKQELGHLIDSACNNHQRIVRAQLEEQPRMPGYEGDRWVALHAYQRREWTELIDRWRNANLQLVAASEAADDIALNRTCTIGGSEPLTIAFILTDYVDHLVHHLQHIGVVVGDRVQAGNAR